MHQVEDNVPQVAHQSGWSLNIILEYMKMITRVFSSVCSRLLVETDSSEISNAFDDIKVNISQTKNIAVIIVDVAFLI